MSHIPYLDSIKRFLSTIYRIVPGVLIFLITFGIFLICWSVGIYLIFSHYLPQAQTFFATLSQVTSLNIMSSQDFQILIQKDHNQFLLFAGVLLEGIKHMIFILFLALVTILLKKAIQFERTQEMRVPEKIQEE